jgi:hypothetical protein
MTRPGLQLAIELCPIISREDRRKTDARQAWIQGFEYGMIHAHEEIYAELSTIHEREKADPGQQPT